jgi:hypothetical protein
MLEGFETGSPPRSDEADYLFRLPNDGSESPQMQVLRNKTIGAVSA